MLKDENVVKFSKMLASKKGKALIVALDKLDNVKNFGIGTKRSSAYRPHRKLVVEQYKVLAKEHPTKDLYELTEVYYDVCIENLRKAQLEIVGELREFVSSNIPFEEQERIGAVISDYEKRIKGISDEPYYRKAFINEIVSAVEDEYKESVRKVAEKMPSSQNDVNSFFVKHYKKAKDSQDIAKRLINDSVASVEHIFPRSNKGENRLSNYLCDCAYCNNTRGPKSFDEWIKELPEGFEQRLQEYLQAIQDNVDSGKLDKKYDDYIKDVIETIEKASNGKIRLAQPETRISAKKQRNLLDRKE
ncbi:MAG: hypothetical protein IKU37_06670 [Candidatus Gastranaerophilales bacterium]|nr:hypothetical protein [Candidatus Gastranaerophilales bacterium]